MLIVASVCLVLALELAVVGWPASSLRTLLRAQASELFDVLMFVLALSGLAGIVIALFSGGVYLLAAQAGGWLAIHGPHLTTGSAAADFALYFLLLDFLFYWVHRLFHTRWLWWIHRMHHSAPALNPLVAFRSNPANAALDPLWRAIPAAVLSGSPNLGAAFGLLFTLHQLFIHSALPWRLGWAGDWFINSPAAHRIHHSFVTEDRDKNFGGQLVIWDRLFGTWRAATVATRSSYTGSVSPLRRHFRTS